ncbi:MAG TPA: GDSL-type esterase/lipase family protein [Acidimicrobiales bacterium]
MVRGSARSARCTLVVLLVAISGMLGLTGTDPAVAVPTQTPPTDYTNPQGIGFSPFVLRVDRPEGPKYYRYVNGFDYPGPLILPVSSSTNLVDWTYERNAMDVSTVGAWANASTGWNFSSPSVLYIPTNPAESQYVLYFTGVQVGTGKKCIGHAISGTPAGPFTGAAVPLICPGDGEALDPSPHAVINQDYQQLLFRKTGTNPGIYNQPLTSNGQAIAKDPNNNDWVPYRVFAGSAAWSGGVVERPSVVVTSPTKRQLFFSGTDSVTGAWAVGTVKCDAGYGLVLACASNPQDGGRWFTSTGQVVSPRRVQVFNDAGGHPWITYQAVKVTSTSCSGAGCVNEGHPFLDKLCFAEGVPRTNAPTVGPTPLARNNDCTADIPGVWVGTWTTALGGVFPPAPPAGSTWRQMLHTSIGGSAVRVRISNKAAATISLTIGDASVAVSTEAAGETSAIQPSSLRPLTFGGANTVVIPPKGEVVSDAITVPVPADHDLAVSLYLPQPPPDDRTGHFFNWETSHIGTGPGPSSLADSTGAGFTSTDSQVHYVAAVDVLADNPAGSVVIMGDSLTDHFNNPDWETFMDGELRWPDKVVDRLAAIGPVRLGIMNHGHVGARLLPDGMEWLDDDILPRQGISTVVLAYGANDVFTDTVPANAPGDIVAGLAQAITKIHGAGMRVVGVTIPPYAYRDNNGLPCNDEPITAVEQQDELDRLWVNDRIRPGHAQSLAFDAVIDFDAVLRDDDVPGAVHPERVKTEYLIPDCAHLTIAGLQALADAVDLAALEP